MGTVRRIFTWWRWGPAPAVGKGYVDEHGTSWLVAAVDRKRHPHRVTLERIVPDDRIDSDA